MDRWQQLLARMKILMIMWKSWESDFEISIIPNLEGMIIKYDSDMLILEHFNENKT